MKVRLGFFSVLCIVLVYSACKKSGASNPGAQSTQHVSAIVAANVVQMLFGGVGGAGSVNGASEFGTVKNNNHLHLKTNDVTTCGSVIIDSTLNLQASQNGISVKLNGEIRMTVACTNGTADGLGFYTNMTALITTPDSSGNEKLNEDFTFDLDQSGTFVLYNGTLGLNESVTYKSKSPATETFNYTLTALKIDENNDVDSGSISFTTTGSGSVGTWNFSGTLVVVSKDVGKITIGSDVYTVNLLTGKLN